MHMDPMMPVLVGSALVILLLGLALRGVRQPALIGYLLAGVVLGPHFLGWLADSDAASRYGSFGVILLLFFIGTEVSLPRLLAKWRVAVLGTALQILVSVGSVAALGALFDWPLGRVLLLGFVISLSSTAVVIRVLQDARELDTDAGQDALGILLVQDFAIVPMLIVVNLLGGHAVGPVEIGLQGLGMVAIFALVVFLARRETIHLPLGRWLRDDAELEVFAGLLLCFGMALVTGLLGLSSALGAFVAGILVAMARETELVHKSLEPFRIVFVALFFVSVGMLVDLDFLRAHALTVLLLVAAALISNTAINAIVLRLLGHSWRRGLYTGAILAQIGEFSFVLAAVGLQAGMISNVGYQMTILVIALTLVISPLWIRTAKLLLLSGENRSPS